MRNELMFSSKSDEWSTPQDTFDALDLEFDFQIDLAASADNKKCGVFFSIENSALNQAWTLEATGVTLNRGYLNPPYSRGLCAKFIAKAAVERWRGFLTVMLLPARTDTMAFHAHIWDKDRHTPRPGVEVRLLKGRLKFGGCKDAAPFPSMVVIFRPETMRKLRGLGPNECAEGNYVVDRAAEI